MHPRSTFLDCLTNLPVSEDSVSRRRKKALYGILKFALVSGIWTNGKRVMNTMKKAGVQLSSCMLVCSCLHSGKASFPSGGRFHCRQTEEERATYTARMLWELNRLSPQSSFDLLRERCQANEIRKYCLCSQRLFLTEASCKKHPANQTPPLILQTFPILSLQINVWL